MTRLRLTVEGGGADRSDELRVLGQDPVSHLAELVERELGEVEAVDTMDASTWSGGRGSGCLSSVSD
jgi:hypothetical protein